RGWNAARAARRAGARRAEPAGIGYGDAAAACGAADAPSWRPGAGTGRPDGGWTAAGGSRAGAVDGGCAGRWAVSAARWSRSMVGWTRPQPTMGRLYRGVRTAMA